MKKTNFIITCIAALLFAACGDSSNSKQGDASMKEHHEGDGHDHGAEDHDGHAHEIYFTCQDHQDIHEHTAGKCPKCQKDLVKMEEEAHDEHSDHDHEVFYTCSAHSDIHEHNAGKCPKCDLELIKKEAESHK